MKYNKKKRNITSDITTGEGGYHRHEGEGNFLDVING